MKYLYIFPHPDDESFGPSLAMSAQLKKGNEVYLLTLTKGGATKQRFKLNKTVEEMGEIRYREMLCVSEKLGLSGLTVLDLPDSGLKEMDPRIIEHQIEMHISTVNPDIIVTYAVYGVSGFHDHLVTHSVVKRIFLELKDSGFGNLKRLAFFTINDEDLNRAMKKNPFHLESSPVNLIDCIIKVDVDDKEKMKAGLKCYETYADTIENSGILDSFGNEVSFEIFGEDHKPPLKDLSEKL